MASASKIMQAFLNVHGGYKKANKPFVSGKRAPQDYERRDGAVGQGR